MDRRSFLTRAGIVGCSAAASPLVTPVTFASAPWDSRLVVIILRGAMDGLDVVQPLGDPDFLPARPTLGGGEATGALDLDGFFALHGSMAALMPLWRAGELSFAHAVSTPYRNKRSHFDGQDILEAGAWGEGGLLPRDGWLNRLLQVSPGVEAETAYAVGTSQMYVLDGKTRVSSWNPRAKFRIKPQARRLLELVYEQDEAFHAAADTALNILEDLAESAEDLEAMRAQASAMMAEMGMSASKPKRSGVLAEFAAGRLRGDSRIAAFSIGGWDTHDKQGAGMKGALKELSQTLLTLKAGLGPVWAKTTVLAMTEFGRTVRENGSRGTDHGTGGAMLMAGGTLRRAQVLAEWPGLSEADMFDRRDLMPTRDVRALAGWAMRDTFGTNRAMIEDVIFPGVDLGKDPGLFA